MINARFLRVLPIRQANLNSIISKHRYYATQAAVNVAANTPPPAAIDQSSDKITKIVDEIASLSLQEASVLVQELKTRLNIKDIVAAQPVMAMAQPAASQEAAEEEKPKEKTEFKITLEKFDAASKAKVIREMKAILPGASLVEAKKFVEGAPKTILESAPKDQVEKIKKALEAVGATVKIE